MQHAPKHHKFATRFRVLPLALCFVLLAGCAPQASSSQSAPAQVIVVPSSSSAPQSVSLPPAQAQTTLPEGFAYVADVCENILLEMRYYSTYNFVGARIDDYNAPVAILTQQAADALATAARQLQEQGYVLKIFDAYRPTGAVQHFARWAQDPEDATMKPYFYPDVDKSQLFAKGYISTKSGHSRGSTVDLTLVNMQTGQELDMGTSFDFFGTASHYGSGLVTAQQAQNREILRTAMSAAGFTPYNNEWWHFTLTDEPYPDTYFDFPVQ